MGIRQSAPIKSRFAKGHIAKIEIPALERDRSPVAAGRKGKIIRNSYEALYKS